MKPTSYKGIREKEIFYILKTGGDDKSETLIYKTDFFGNTTILLYNRYWLQDVEDT